MLSTNQITTILKEQFSLECTDITKVIGGLSAEAYRVKTLNGDFFLKVYDKQLTQTHLWIENIDNYMPLLLWLNQNEKLRGKIIFPLTTINGNYRVEDKNYVYILFEYISGTTIAKRPLTDTQVVELSEIMAQLHSCSLDISVISPRMIENFDIPFCDSLQDYLAGDYAAAPEDIRSILHPCMEQLSMKIRTLQSTSQKVKQMNPQKVLCHTDAHGWNLMQSDRLVLVDWEGMKLAPAEADLFMWAAKDYWDVFYSHYHKIRPDFEIDQTILTFYCIRRKLEDIWAFLESLLYDDSSEEQRAEDLIYLANECKNLDAFCF